MIDDNYLKEHNINSISVMSEGTIEPLLIVKLSNGNEIKLKCTYESLNDDKIKSVIDEHEYKIKVKNRLNKINKIISNSC
jgi:hypothetical protein